MKLQPGDRVAIVSPSWAGPGIFPDRHEQAMERIRSELGLEPVEYPTTRHQGTPAERAADLMAAYADPSIRAVFATIGGDDQITVLPHLDPAPFRADPKPFFGYSDNTNLLNWLWLHGVPGCHGGSTLVHLARGGGVEAEHLASLRAALFIEGELEITPVPSFTDEEIPWTDPSSLSSATPYVRSPGWIWHNADRAVSGPTWGGNLEILHWNLAANRWIRPNEDYAGSILLLETSEEMPSDDEVFRMLRNFGERGLLQQFPAVLVATAKAANLEKRPPQSERQRFRDDQREAVLRALHAYHPTAMAVFGVDFGHTSPQWVLPYGGSVTVDGPGRRLLARY